MRIENQHTEFKQIWKDGFLKSICAFANAQGGTLYVGVNNNGEVTGIQNYTKLLEDLPTTKYMKANIDYEGITRTETYDYPEKALREAILNAVIHKDYSSNVPVQISVYDRWLMIYNSGRLPEGWTLETLTQKHSSIPANPDIARVFFRAGYIENWGRGIKDMISYCTRAGLPEPFYKQMGAGFALVFEKEKGAADFSYASEIGKTTQETTQETIQETTQEKITKSALDIIKLIEQNPSITRKEMANKLNYISEEGIKYNLEKLKKMGYIKHKGSTKSGSWVIIKNINY